MWKNERLFINNELNIFNPKKIKIENINGYLSIYQNEKKYILNIFY